MQRRRVFPFVTLFLAFALPVMAQETVIQSANVRTEFAQVLRAEPVYQTLRATSMVERCEQSSPVEPGSDEQGKHGFARVIGAVRNVFTPEPKDDEEGAAATSAKGRNCHMVSVDKSFQRPIAYDVDYVHHGIKYRSRLPYDPGNRLRVRVSITPIVPGSAGN